MTVHKKLGRAIQVIRSLRGMTQTDLAVAIGVNPSHLSRIEKGYNEPSLEVITKIAAALDVSLSDIYLLVNADQSNLVAALMKGVK